MNSDAHEEAERLMDVWKLGLEFPHEMHEALIAAMRWAYADAAKACREHADSVSAGLERRTEQCPNGCDHTDAEHSAFDAGVRAGKRGDHQCPYRGSLREDWLTGHSVGMLNRRSNAELSGGCKPSA